jgi:hypothetical protein
VSLVTGRSRRSDEVDNIRPALRWLRKLYGHTESVRFESGTGGDSRGKGWGRPLPERINKDVDRIKRLFRWAASKKLVPLETHQLLQTVEALRAGRSAARETEPVKPVPAEWREATLPFTASARQCPPR